MVDLLDIGQLAASSSSDLLPFLGGFSEAGAPPAAAVAAPVAAPVAAAPVVMAAPASTGAPQGFTFDPFAQGSSTGARTHREAFSGASLRPWACALTLTLRTSTRVSLGINVPGSVYSAQERAHGQKGRRAPPPDGMKAFQQVRLCCVRSARPRGAAAGARGLRVEDRGRRGGLAG